MEAILSEILDKLQDIDDAMSKGDINTHDALQALVNSLYDFVSNKEDEANRTAWLKSAGVI